jgi:hypothetical protein
MCRKAIITKEDLIKGSEGSHHLSRNSDVTAKSESISFFTMRKNIQEEKEALNIYVQRTYQHIGTFFFAQLRVILRPSGDRTQQAVHLSSKRESGLRELLRIPELTNIHELAIALKRGLLESPDVCYLFFLVEAVSSKK